MSKNNENKLVPKLRFPEFTKDGEWHLNRLGNVYAFITTNSFSRDDLNYDKGEVKNIHYGDIHTKFSTLFDITKENVPFINESISLNKVKKENYCEEGDVIFADASEDLKDVGKSIEVVNLDNKKLLSGLHTLLARQINSKFAIGFGGYLFLNDRIRKQIQRESQGAKVLGISATRLSNINIFYPKERNEQEKIASCLLSLDEVITGENQKLDILKDYKKCLLQNLLPQEGETVPRFRFKEFEDSEEWVEKTIEQVAKVTTGNKDTQNKVDNGKYPFFVRSQNVERINSYAYDGEAILTSGDGVGVGKNFHYIIGKFDFHQRVYCIYDFKKAVSGRFVYMYFSQHFYERVMRISAKNSVDSIRRAMITEMPILMPSKKEQEKIANTLSSVDELINAQSQKLEALKLHKKGLLQGLFPNLNTSNSGYLKVAEMDHFKTE